MFQTMYAVHSFLFNHKSVFSLRHGLSCFVCRWSIILKCSESLLSSHKVYFFCQACFQLNTWTLGGVSLSFEDWLYRKSEQNAHSEIMAFLLVVLSVNLLLGGLVVTVLTVGQS